MTSAIGVGRPPGAGVADGIGVGRRQGVWVDWALAAGLLLLAAGVRFYLLRELPPGLYNDEAAYANDALGVLKGQHALFFERNNGREPLFIYLLALVFQLFGAGAYTIRATAALVGALTVPAAYWLAAASTRFEFPHRPALARRMGLWVGLFLAFSYWHLSFSRVGFRAITLPLIMCLAFACIWRAWRRLRDEEGLPWSDLLAGGGLLGLTLYTYTSGRMALAIFGFLALVSLLRATALGVGRRRLLVASGVILAMALLVCAPLASYFVTHPASFGARAASVSIFSQEFAPEGPAAALLNGVVKTALMFFSEHDGNLRHNPAQRPVFDPLLGLWLLAGSLLALVQWRRLPTLVYLAWALLMAAPALFSAEGVPHSLRTIGMIPAVFVLPVSAMLWAGEKLFRRSPLWASLLPLPFFLFSSIVGVRAYFGAWQPAERFRAPFLTDYVALSEAIAERGGVWFLALSPNYRLSDSEFNTMTFIVGDRAQYATILMQEEVAAQQLAQIPPEQTNVHVLHPYEWPELSETSFVFLDAKGLLDFLLRRNGRLASVSDGADIGGMPYSIYELNPERSFAIPDEVRPLDARFGEAVALTGVTLGGVGEGAIGETVTLLADQPLWAVLRWNALQPIDFDLKTSLLLQDSAGQIVGQIDGLLTSDRYPVERVWEVGEAASTYHILEALPAIPPGEYTLLLKVYEDASGRVYTVPQPDGSLGVTTPLATVQIKPPQTLPIVTPAITMTTPVTGGVALLGHDPLPETAAPGGSLSLTLYWRAEEQPARDLTRRVRLMDAEGTVIGEDEAPPGGPHYATSAWRPGEIVRDPIRLVLAPDAPAGRYDLEVELIDGADGASEMIASVEVKGRPRLYEMPAVEQEAGATFGDAVRLVGLDAPPQLEVAAGETISVALLWQPLRSASEGLVRFTQLLDAGGVLVTQQDTIPCAAECPSTSWLAGEYLLDPAQLALPAELPAGRYQLVTGWYNPETQQRLPAVDAQGAPLSNDVVVLPVEVERP